MCTQAKLARFTPAAGVAEAATDKAQNGKASPAEIHFDNQVRAVAAANTS